MAAEAAGKAGAISLDCNALIHPTSIQKQAAMGAGRAVAGHGWQLHSEPGVQVEIAAHPGNALVNNRR